MNKVILMGRLTKEPEVRYTNSGTSIARFTLAVDRRFKRDGDEQTADFINCVSFGKTAEFLERYGHKGSKFIVEGHIQTGNYTNKDNQRVYTTDVMVEQLEFAESKSSTGNVKDDSNKNTPDWKVEDGFMNLPDGIDEDLPFN